LIVGVMQLFTMQALGEMAVMYPVNGAFYTYVVRFIDPSWYVYIYLYLSGLPVALSYMGTNLFLLLGASLSAGNTLLVG
jgi:amino acid transporter